MAPLFVAGTAGAVMMMALGLSLMGLTYGPLGTVLSELFPTPVRYTGSSLTFNFAGIFGASLAPYIATWLAKNYGLQYVGYYLSAAAALTLDRTARGPRNQRRRSLTSFDPRVKIWFPPMHGLHLRFVLQHSRQEVRSQLLCPNAHAPGDGPS